MVQSAWWWFWGPELGPIAAWTSGTLIVIGVLLFAVVLGLVTVNHLRERGMAEIRERHNRRMKELEEGGHSAR